MPTLTRLGPVATASGIGTSLVMPVTTTVPPSDPVEGASIVLIFLQVRRIAFGAGPGLSIHDDAPPGSYGSCLYTDGLNHYGIGFDRVGHSYQNPRNGAQIDAAVFSSFLYGAFLTNELEAGVNSITIDFGGPTYAAHAVAVAYSGAHLEGSYLNQLPFLWQNRFVSPNDPYGAVAFGDGSHPATTLQFTFQDWTTGAPFGVGTPHIWTPTFLSGQETCLYPDYEWLSGELLVYCIADGAHGPAYTGFTHPLKPAFETGASGPWTWSDPSITTIWEEDDFDDGAGHLLSMLVAEQVVPSVPLVGQDINGSWAGILPSYTWGGAASLNAGPGPSCAYSDPLLRCGYCIPKPDPVAGDPPEVDAADPNPGEGIVLALPNHTLEMGQTWTRID